MISIKSFAVILFIVCALLSSSEGRSLKSKMIQKIHQLFQPSNDYQYCEQCKFVFQFAIKDGLLVFLKQKILKQLEIILEKQCLGSVTQNEQVCQMIAAQTAPVGLKIIEDRLFDPEMACPLLELCPQVYQPINIDQLVKKILQGKPNNQQVPTPTGRDTLKVLHLTDIHLDTLYQPGTPTQCGLPICCHSNSTGNGSAGIWGTYVGCDLPVSTFQQFANFVKNNLKIDFILWTGDNESHDVWLGSKERNKNHTGMITQILKDTIGVPIYAINGNEDAFPDYIYDFNGPREDDLKIYFAKIWQEWIGRKAADQLRERGFYATELTQYNLKIVALNTLACVIKNYFLIDNPTDPGHMLEWLQDELLISEQKNQSVIIISHIPTLFCEQTWATVYSAIVDRFSYTIRGQFYGHTHSDQLTIYKDFANNQSINSGFVSPSMTTLSDKNPSFRVYEIDVDTMLPMNYNQYRLNLTYWNQVKEGPLQWELAYRFLQEYNLPNMNLSSLDTLVNQLATNSTVQQTYYNNYYTYWSNEQISLARKPLPSASSVNPFYCLTNTLPNLYYDCLGQKQQQSKLNIAILDLQGPWKERINNTRIEEDELI